MNGQAGAGVIEGVKAQYGNKKTELNKFGFTQSGGAYGARTRDLLTASQTRSQLR